MGDALGSGEGTLVVGTGVGGSEGGDVGLGDGRNVGADDGVGVGSADGYGVGCSDGVPLGLMGAFRGALDTHRSKMEAELKMLKGP